MSDDIAIGIDLGTSNSCVAVLLDGQPSAIPNEGGEQTHAAGVCFLPLEARLVKNAFRDAKRAGRLRVLTKKPITAGPSEVRQNRRARSAKLRLAERPL